MITLPPPLEPMAWRPRWALWRYYSDTDGKRRKLPYDLDQVPGLGKDRTPRFGTLAECFAQWGHYPDAFAGVGFVPNINDQIACLDFDALPHPLWPELLDTTYCERSPSNVENKGHAVVTLRPFAKKRLQGIRNLAGFELYSDSGFFTVTCAVLNGLPIADYSNRLVNLADRVNAQPKDPTNAMPILPTGRVVTQLEKGSIWHKIERWSIAHKVLAMRDDWPAVCASTWAPRSKAHPSRIDRSQCMIDFASWLAHAGARDPDLLMALIAESAVWRDGYSKRENAADTLIRSVIPFVLAKYPAPPKGDGKPVLPSCIGSTPDVQTAPRLNHVEAKVEAARAIEEAEKALRERRP